MKIIVYDPLYSDVGHYFRYNKFITGLLSDIPGITSIHVLCSDKKLVQLEQLSSRVKVSYLEQALDSMQVRSMNARGWGKVRLALRAYSSYSSIVRMINKSDADLVFFPSQGQLPFWMAAKKLKKQYASSLISIKWIYEKRGKTFPLYVLFRSFIKRATLNIFIEDYYQAVTNEHTASHSIVMPDRSLKENEVQSINDHSKPLSFVTLGTISRIKSPYQFLSEWKSLSPELLSNFRYRIFGKVFEESLSSELKQVAGECINVEFVNDYLSSSMFNELLDSADFVVIPYSEDYAKYATSGVMWDCFEKQKAIICPDIEPFRFYVNKFRIGYMYVEGELENTLQRVINERREFFKELPANYKKLSREYSQQRFISLVSESLNKAGKLKA